MTQTISPISLSNGDERILNQVFDPESSPETPVVKVDISLPPDPHITDTSLLSNLKAKELEAIQFIESISSKPTVSVTISPQQTEEDTKRQTAYTNAITILNEVITQQPSYASSYNNRAQLRRWYFADDLLTPNASTAKDLSAVISDLRRAITLASPQSANGAVSKSQARLLMQAWTQLGAVFWSLGRRRSASKEMSRSEQPVGDSKPEADEAEDWTVWDGHRLEEEGSRCFFAAGMYGSDVGRGLAVKTNPYARLCGGIVKEAMRRDAGI